MVTHDLHMLFSKLDTLMQRGVIRRTIVVPFRSVLPPLKGLLFSIFKRGDVADVRASRSAEKVVDGSKLATTREPPRPVAIDPMEDIAVLQYTGGTTGVPKGAMLTHANIVATPSRSLPGASA